MIVKARQLKLEFPYRVEGGKTPPKLPGQFSLSQVLDDLEEHYGFRKKSTEAEKATRSGYLDAGNLWEEVLASTLFRARGHRQQVFAVLDGIRVKCDALFPDLIEEDKATYKSLKQAQDDFEGNFRKWHWQGKSYCKVFERDTVKFIVWFVMGDYRGSGPIVAEFIVKYEADEIAETWQMVTAHAERMRKRG